MPAVCLDSAVKRYGTTTALDAVSFTLGRGEVLALLGPNGAGKTTTVELCEGFLAPDTGTVRVLGLDPLADCERLRPRMGVMPQDGGAYPGSRAGEMLELIASYSDNPLDTSWLLDTLGLAEAQRTACRRLSGGQRQRLALACALVGRPELVFLDEPTAGMDTQGRHLVWELITALRRDGVSVLLTTHLMDEAEQLADRLVIIDHGRVVAAGTPAEVTAAGAARELCFTAPARLDLARLAAALPDGFTPRECAPGHYLLTGDITPAILAAVAAWCERINVLPSEIRVDMRRLEDVFLELTGRELRS